ncbi:histone-lysine N-methyltransferase SETMAR-like [Cryptotermes secundus]|uniref:histone-lysine N-methyltransferase SETMAR-like n=1 Tax=Cryptotermes secundus TaxID=105785 RepID=UPI001454CBB2|nr:histone-lysine N-methyltransferase SETMAR-like [Cryptotermes secundus]
MALCRCQSAKMVGVLNTSTLYEQRSVIHFLWSKGRMPIEIHREMQLTYVDKCLALRSVWWWWCSKFTNGWEDLNDNERLGQPLTSLTLDNTARVDAMVKADWCVHLKVISKEPGILYGSVYNIIRDFSGYHKVSCPWVPKLLDDLNKAKRMMMSLPHLQHYFKEGEWFLDLIVTGDETWVLHFTPKSKQQSMVWKHPGSPVTEKFRRMPSIRKLMVIVFWDR